MIIVKVSLGTEIKRIAFDDSGATLESLCNLIRVLFPVLERQPFTLKYKDDEGDIISVLSDLELQECFRQALQKKTSQPVVLRLWIDTGDAETQVQPKEDPNQTSQMKEPQQPQPSQPSQQSQQQSQQGQQLETSSAPETPNPNEPLYPKLESKDVSSPTVLPLTSLNPSTNIQKKAEFDFLKTIEHHLQNVGKMIMDLIRQLNIDSKIGQLFETCQKHVKLCQEKLALMGATIGKNVENLGKNIENIAKQTRDDFQKEFGILKQELRNLRNEIAVALQKAAEAQKERKDAGKVYFPPLLAFKDLRVDTPPSSNQDADTTANNSQCNEGGASWDSNQRTQSSQESQICPKDDLTESELVELIQHFELISNSVSQQQPQASSASVDTCNKYESGLRSLKEMGFLDTEKNIELLVKHQGDVVAVVDELLKSTN
jgi:hypothetical protein